MLDLPRFESWHRPWPSAIVASASVFPCASVSSLAFAMTKLESPVHDVHEIAVPDRDDVIRCLKGGKMNGDENNNSNGKAEDGQDKDIGKLHYTGDVGAGAVELCL